uniref:rod shape-determining protein MreC n=1 Tax=Prevotella sp. TaxID=59823 RepID=UPI003FEF29F8
MRNLIDFLARHNHWFLFILHEVLSFVLLSQYHSYQGSVWFSSANAVSGKVFEWNASVTQYFSLVDVNKTLTERNIYLERQVEQLTEQLEKAGRDSTEIERMQTSVLKDCNTIPAKVVSCSLNKLNNFITIDKGYADGVRKDMGVVCGTGVVGIVYLVSEHYSVLIPVLSSVSNISCTIRSRGYFGYLHWKGGSPEEAYIDDIPRHARFKLGDVIVTSGYSSVFPPGIVVGKIKHVYNSANGLSYRLKITLSTDFGRLRDVCVINDKEMDRKLEILHAAEDSISAR